MLIPKQKQKMISSKSNCEGATQSIDQAFVIKTGKREIKNVLIYWEGKAAETKGNVFEGTKKANSLVSPGYSLRLIIGMSKRYTTIRRDVTPSMAIWYVGRRRAMKEQSKLFVSDYSFPKIIMLLIYTTTILPSPAVPSIIIMTIIIFHWPKLKVNNK